MEITLDFAGIYKKVKLLLTDPNAAFGKIKQEEGFKQALVFYAVLSVVGLVLGTAFNFLALPYLASAFPTEDFVSYIPFLLWSYFFGLFTTFVYAGIVLVWLKLFGAKLTFSKAYNLFVYSRTPSYLLGWIPYINVLSFVWSAYLLFFGLNKMKYMTKVRALMSVTLGVILLITIFGILLASYQGSL